MGSILVIEEAMHTMPWEGAMDSLGKKRFRKGVALAVLFIALGVGQAVLQRNADAQNPSPSGYILGPNEGEALARGPTSIRVKMDPVRGSRDMAAGTQLLPKGAGIPVHQHTAMDELLYVLEGSGSGQLGEARTPLEKGSAIYIPKGAWHGVQNPDADLLILWVVAPPGLEAYFREASPKPGAQPLSREQTQEIARKYGTAFK